MSNKLKSWLPAIWVLTTMLQLVVVGFVAAEEPEDIVFFDDYNKALQEARLTKKPIFLEFRCAP